MRWFRLGRGRRQVQHDPARQQALAQEIRNRFGPRTRVRYSDQASEIVRTLNDDDGLSVAIDVVREFADASHQDLLGQVATVYRETGHQLTVQRKNYRPLWRAAEGRLRWSLFALPCGLFPYIHVASAVAVIGDRAERAVQVTAPEPVLARVFEILDLTVAGWEFGGVRVDPDAAALAEGLVSTAQRIRAAMKNPPPLPPPVRELMRRNNTIDVRDPMDNRVVGGINPGKLMRESLLI